jgi:hypothetical protein
MSTDIKSTARIAEELLDAAEEVGTSPIAYFQSRGIEHPPASLRLLDRSLMHLLTGIMLPAIVAPIVQSDGRITGAHVTYLTADAKENATGVNGKMRRMYGQVSGGIVVLEPADPAMPLIIGEGIETVSSAMQIAGLPGAAALSATNLAKIDPPECTEVIIAADADKAGMEAAEKLAARLAAAGRRVRIAVPTTAGNDWNDELIARDDTEELKHQLVEAPLYEVASADEETTEFLAEVKPWPGSVDGAELLGELVSVFGRHMVLPKGAAEAMALWVLHSYAHDAARHSPILFISSPTKRCGKTNLLSVLHLLTPKPVSAASVTQAVVFRAIDAWKPTMLIDEADTFMSDKSELRGVLNSGHTRSQAYVLRCSVSDKNIIPQQFSTWCPKAFAAIGRIHPTLVDRSITVELQRKPKARRVERVPRETGTYSELRQKAARWAADNMTRLEDSDPDAPTELSDRARDNWVPLLAIADLAGGDWPDRARDAARLLSSVDDDEGDAEMLLQDMRAIFDRKDADKLWSDTIVEALHEMEGRPWAEFKNGKSLTAHALARLLKPFNVFPIKIRIDGGKKRSGYLRERLEPVWRRYLDGGHPNQTGQTGQRKQKQQLKGRSTGPKARTRVRL